MNLKIDVENYLFFKALASKTRLKILNILLKESKNYKELAEILNVSSAVISKHLEILIKANIVEVSHSSGKKGRQNVCRLVITNYELDYHNDSSEGIEEFEIPIGHYENIKAFPTCGIATEKKLLGRCDDPRYFSHPERYDAQVLWFKEGVITYKLPGYSFEKNYSTLEISLELCSEAPGINEDYLSDIYFFLNDISIGLWVSPGDFGKKKGKFTPKWWYLSEYGILVTLKICEEGTFINDKKISDKKIADYNISSESDSFLKIFCPKDTKNPGGINIFGKGFGNYNQDICVKLS